MEAYHQKQKNAILSYTDPAVWIREAKTLPKSTTLASTEHSVY